MPGQHLQPIITGLYSRKYVGIAWTLKEIFFGGDMNNIGDMDNEIHTGTESCLNKHDLM